MHFSEIVINLHYRFSVNHVEILENIIQKSVIHMKDWFIFKYHDIWIY